MTTRLPDRGGSNALLIGVAHFAQDTLTDLPAVARNVASLAAVLTDEVTGILEPNRCEVLLDPVRPREVGAALERAASAATDTMIVYFAGHGLLDNRGSLYLATADTDPDYVSYTAVSIELVRSALAESPANNRILILDCCFSGHATEAMTAVSSALTAAIDIRGTYTIASAPPTSAAIAPVGADFTAFTDELLSVLGQGIPDAGELLSLREIYQALVRRLLSRAMPRPQSLTTGVTDLIAIARNAAITTTPPAFHEFQSVPLIEMSDFPRRWLRSGYRIDEVQRWVAATVDPSLRTGEHWPGPPTVPRFRKQMAGWDPDVVDAFAARYIPFRPSALFGDGRTPFAAELSTILVTEQTFEPAEQLSSEQVTLLRRQLRLPDAERLVGGIISGHGPFTEYVYFTDWGLRARNDRGESTMLLRIHNDNAQLLSIPYANFPLASFSTADHLNMPFSEASLGGVTWYEVDIFFDQALFTVLSASTGEWRAARVVNWLKRVQDLCAQHVAPEDRLTAAGAELRGGEHER